MAQTELDNRLAAAWAAFAKYRAELCNNRLSTACRAKLFESVVSSTFLYGSASWTMTRDLGQQMQTTRRQMLRMMFGGKRRRDHNQEEQPLELWVDFVQRATHKAQDVMARHGSLDWCQQQRQRKWRLAGRLAATTDNRWSAELLAWRPLHGFGRRVARPWNRWSTDICALAGGNWLQHAQNSTLWSHLEDGFVMIR